MAVPQRMNKICQAVPCRLSRGSIPQEANNGVQQPNAVNTDHDGV